VKVAEQEPKSLQALVLALRGMQGRRQEVQASPLSAQDLLCAEAARERI